VATAASTWRLHVLVAFCAAIAALALTASTAMGSATSLNCSGTAETPFLRWLDPASYTLAPGGTFEGSSTTWKLASGAKLTTGNESFKVHGSTEKSSLYLPAGATATTPAFCVGLLYPIVRMFAVGGNLTSPLKVEVVYQTVLGTATQPVTYVSTSGSWQPTLPALLLANVTGLTSLDGLTSSVRLRFTALGTASWRIDDLYVDPWKVT
jgi:hypothetical protein